MLPGMTYKGGKGGNGVYQAIINQMPHHERYFELCLGGGSVLLHKLPASTNYGVDVDSGVIAQFEASRATQDIKLLVADACQFLRIYPFQDNDLIYLDPPYLFDVRTYKGPIYKYEWDREKHLEMLTLVLKLSAQIMISGYDSEMYDRHLADWRKAYYFAVDRKGRRRRETLWMNYSEPTELHDYRYVGSNFRERWNLKRKINNKKRQLAKMDNLERLALMEALKQSGWIS